MTMKRFLILFSISLLISLLFEAVAQEENHDAVFLSVTIEYTLHGDGTMDYRYAKQLKLQNYRSFHRLYGETFVVYNPAFQKLEINEAYTIMADGKKVMTPGNAFNEVLPRVASHAPAFNGLREMVITHTGLEIGATIVLDYTVRTASGFFPAFMGSNLFAETQPVKSMTVIVRTPADQPLFYHLFNSDTKPSEKTENGYRVYTWTMTNLPAIPHEPYQPDESGIYPALVFSSLDCYQSLVDFYMQQEAFRYQTTPTMKEFVADLESGNKEKKELVFAIQESVVKDLNLFSIPDEYTGYRLRTPARVWNSNGGTTAEKAVLMTTLLKQAGLQADPVLQFNGNVFDETVGTLTTLDDWIVRVEAPVLGETYLSVKQANAFDMTQLEPPQVLLVLKENSAFDLVRPTVNATGLNLKGVFILDTNMTLSGELTGSVTEAANPFLALIRSEKKLKSYLRGLLASTEFKDIVLSSITTNTSSFSCSANKKNALERDSDFYLLSLPYISTGIDSWSIRELVAQRDNPVEIPYPVEESYDLTIAIPENLKLVSGEQEIRIKNAAGSLLYLVKEKGNMLQIRKELAIDKKIIETPDYEAFKELMDTWNLPQTNELIFRK